MATKAKPVKELRKELNEARYAASVLAQAFADGRRPPARIITQALGYKTTPALEPDERMLFGDLVLVHRGNNMRTTGPGRGRLVRMRLIGQSDHGVYCQLTEDDLDDTVGLCHAGDKGFWSCSSVTQVFESSNPAK